MEKLKHISLFEEFESDTKLKGHDYTIEELRSMGHEIVNFKTEEGEVIEIDGVPVDMWIQSNIEEQE